MYMCIGVSARALERTVKFVTASDIDRGAAAKSSGSMRRQLAWGQAGRQQKEVVHDIWVASN